MWFYLQKGQIKHKMLSLGPDPCDMIKEYKCNIRVILLKEITEHIHRTDVRGDTVMANIKLVYSVMEEPNAH